MNALFESNILVALRPLEFRSEAPEKADHLHYGETKLFGQKLLLENLPVVVPRPPGVFG
jgi:hypothetical protein